MTTSWKLACAGGAIALAGMALGAWLFGPEPARAQQGPYRQCVSVVQRAIDVNDEGIIAGLEMNRTVLIPSGWEPIGGGGSSIEATVVLCRR